MNYPCPGHRKISEKGPPLYLILFTPTDLTLEDIAAKIAELPPVNNVPHFHVWQLKKKTQLEAHVDFKKDILLSEFDSILEDIEELVYHEFGINHVNIQPEFGKCDSKELVVQD